MKSNILYTCCLLLWATAAGAQVSWGSYTSDTLVEYQWDKKQKKYVLKDTLPMTTRFVFDDKRIYFKKGEAKWLQNSWYYQKENQRDGLVFDTYHDERQQGISIEYTCGMLWYFYEWDKKQKIHRKVTWYYNLTEDPRLDNDKNGIARADTIRLDFNQVWAYDEAADEWNMQEYGTFQFLININADGDVMHLNANGDTLIYKRQPQLVQKGATDAGNLYRVFTVKDDKGNIIVLQYFYDPEKGLKMISDDTMLQFLNE
jgi:hypothetical protein